MIQKINDEIAISINSVSKYFRPYVSSRTLKNVFTNFYRNRNTKKDGYWALKDINLEIKKGEFFGIVGRNGSGKSTLLKLIAGVYTPTSGVVRVNGKLVPFIELGVGFNPELSGRDNVFLNGALLGFTRKEMKSMYEEIVDFAELRDHMDVKLKNFSSGMQVRLAFSIAIRAKADILLIDEVLAVGDVAFQKKCYEYFMSLKNDKKTIVFVTHDMSAVQKFCDRVLVISNSGIEGIYSPTKASEVYSNLNIIKSNSNSAKDKLGPDEVIIKNIKVNGGASKNISLSSGDSLTIEIEMKSLESKNIVVGMAFINDAMINLSGPNSVGCDFKSTDKIKFTVSKLSIAPGHYGVDVVLYDKSLSKQYDKIERAISLNILSDSSIVGLVNLGGKWSKEN